MAQSDKHKKNNYHKHMGSFMLDKRNDWMDYLLLTTTGSHFFPRTIDCFREFSYKYSKWFYNKKSTLE